MNNKEYGKFQKLLDNFDVQDKISDLFVSIVKCLKYELRDEDMTDMTEQIIKEEVGMERIDTEAITFIALKEFEKWKSQ